MAPSRQVGDGVRWVPRPRLVVEAGQGVEDGACLLAGIGQPSRKRHVTEAALVLLTGDCRAIGHARSLPATRYPDRVRV